MPKKKEIELAPVTEQILVVMELPKPVSARHNIQYMPLAYERSKPKRRWHYLFWVMVAVTAALLITGLVVSR